MTTVIRPKRSPWDINLHDLWRSRELLFVFVWRDIKVRYRQTFLGIAWVLFQPVVTTAVFSIFFGKLAKIPSGDLPYPLFSFSSLILWNFFSGGLTLASNSVVLMGPVIKKIYFPRLFIPLSAVLTSVVDFFVSLIPLILMFIYYRIIPSPLLILFLPLLLFMLSLNTLGLGLFLATLNVRYRDIRFLVPFFVQIGIFVTPVIYPLSIIYDYRKWFLIANPLTGIFETFRTLVAGSNNIDFGLVLISLLITLIVFTFGLFYFSRSEDNFADYV